MKKILLLFVYFILAGLANNALADYPIVGYRYIADPGAMVYNGRVYIYCSNDDENVNNNGYQMSSLVCISSSDMKNWTDHGVVVDVPRDASWTSLSWAPSPVYRDGKFYLYYGNGGSAIGVLVADSPLGPFRDPIGRSLVNGNTPGVQPFDGWLFDPMTFVDDDGQAYMYFGGNGDNNLRVIKLNDDMISIDGAATAFNVPNFFEAAWVHKYNGTYYFSYSTTPSAGIRIDYMTSNNPTSGFTYRGVMSPQPPQNNNNNHQAVFEFGGNWYQAYHNRTVATNAGEPTAYKRNMAVDQLFHQPDGSIARMINTVDGLDQIGNLDPFIRQEAETMSEHNGIETEVCSAGGMNLSYINNNDWIMVEGVDFEDGASSFEASVASPNAGGSIEIRLGSPTGTLIGTLSVPNTGGFQNWQTVSTSVNAVSGVHNLYFVFKGGGGSLFNFDHWIFYSSGPIVSITQPENNDLFFVGDPITVNVSAQAQQGNITQVELFVDGQSVGTDNSSPYTFTLNNLTKGNHIIEARATDSQGEEGASEITIMVNVPQAPYQGNLHPIPGTIQLEEYDVGGNGNAYYDDTEGSETGVNYRTDEDVDIENCTDTGGGYNIGWATSGEWLEYSVDVTTPGIYELQIRAACNGADRTVSVAMDGEDIATDVAIPNTTGWQAWQTVTVENIQLMPGEKIMRLTIGATDYVNLNYVTFNLVEEFVQEPYNGTPHAIPGRIEAEEYDLGREGLGYHEANENGNQGNATFRGDEVDIETTGDTDGEYNIAYTLTGEWLAYTVNVAQTGLYDIDLRVARDGANGSLHIEMDGNNITGAIAVPNTGAWQTYQTVTVNDINLTAGEHEMRIVFDTDYMNLNYVVFTAVIQDADNDGTPDDEDVCPNDPNKATTAGQCGCGNAETDSDGDGIANCVDNFPNDKDNDGVTTANDCDDNNASIGAATVWYQDTDGDGVGVSNNTQTSCTKPTGYVATAGDECPNDINKTTPGNCGCGNTEESCLDCAGTPNGTAFLDNCDNCVATQQEACEQDCNGDWGGTAVIDACDECTGGNTGLPTVTDPTKCVATGIEGYNTEKLLVYPNPTKGEVYLQERSYWKLMDITGNVLTSGYTDQVNLESYSPGMYYLNIEDELIKVIKE